ncbi:MAG: hypothetical protein ABH879_10645 [archaeon]
MKALMMIFLVVMIPVYASVSAAEIHRVRAYGAAGVDNFVRKGDTVTYDVSASLGKAITPDNIRLNDHPFSEFCDSTNCIEDGSRYNCTCTDSYVPEDLFKAEFALWDEGAVDSATLTIRRDDSAPVIDSFDATFERGENVTVSYSVTDEEPCSGLDKVEIYVDGVKAETDELNGECSHAAEKKLSAAEGRKKFYIIAYDRMGNSKALEEDRYVTLTIDYSPPAISGTFRILKNGLPLEFISTKGPYSSVRGVSVELDVNDASDISAVADLSELNLNPAVDYSRMLGSCEGETAKVCTWDNGGYGLTLDAKSGTLQIDIEATDELGNSAVGEATAALTLDNTGPLATFLGTDACTDECYAKKDGNRIVVQFTESGAGLSQKDVILDLGRLNDAYLGQMMHVHECEPPNGAVWTCYGYIDMQGPRSGQRIVIRLVSGTRDDAGNEVTGRTSAEIIADADAPEFTAISVRPVGVERDVILDGDVVEIVANITERHSGLIAENVLADVSEFFPDQEPMPAQSCDEVAQGRYTCAWEYAGPIDGNRELKLTITAKDNAGNVKNSRDDRVYGEIYLSSEREREVNWWKPSAKVDPIGELNRNFLILGQGTYQRVKIRLEPYAGTPKYVHAINFRSCSGAIGGHSYNPGIHMQAGFAGDRTSRLLVLNLPGGGEYRSVLNASDKIEINCTAEIIQSSSARGAIYTPYEEVTAKIEIPLKEGVFSDPGIRKIDEIKKYKDVIKKLELTIDMIKGITDILEPTCQGLNAIRQIMSAVTGSLCFPALQWIPGMPYACETSAQAMTRINSVWRGVGPNEPGSKYSYRGIGFYCQMVLCTECENIAGKALRYMNKGIYTPGIIREGEWGGINPNEDNPVGLGDVKNNILTSATCWPPCITGIRNSMERTKAILVGYNVCLRRNEILDEPVTDCREFRNSMLCQQVTGALWDFFLARYIQALVHGRLAWLAENYVFINLEHSCATESAGFWHHFGCAVGTVKDAAGIWLQFNDGMDSFRSLGDRYGSTEEQEQSAEEAVKKARDDYGGEPEYE